MYRLNSECLGTHRQNNRSVFDRSDHDGAILATCSQPSSLAASQTMCNSSQATDDDEYQFVVENSTGGWMRFECRRSVYETPGDS
eukprot:m.351316 g.351316  ORF g.351316 m.351316 type:complete len:85 (-) comp20697_c0_seq2:2029-2283(-)